MRIANNAGELVYMGPSSAKVHGYARRKRATAVLVAVARDLGAAEDDA